VDLLDSGSDRLELNPAAGIRAVGLKKLRFSEAKRKVTTA
jgi:hypothetical protein